MCNKRKILNKHCFVIFLVILIVVNFIGCNVVYGSGVSSVTCVAYGWPSTIVNINIQYGWRDGIAGYTDGHPIKSFYWIGVFLNGLSVIGIALIVSWLTEVWIQYEVEMSLASNQEKPFNRYQFNLGTLFVGFLLISGLYGIFLNLHQAGETFLAVFMTIFCPAIGFGLVLIKNCEVRRRCEAIQKTGFDCTL